MSNIFGIGEQVRYTQVSPSFLPAMLGIDSGVQVNPARSPYLFFPIEKDEQGFYRAFRTMQRTATRLQRTGIEVRGVNLYEQGYMPISLGRIIDGFVAQELIEARIRETIDGSEEYTKIDPRESIDRVLKKRSIELLRRIAGDIEVDPVPEDLAARIQQVYTHQELIMLGRTMQNLCTAAGIEQEIKANTMLAIAHETVPISGINIQCQKLDEMLRQRFPEHTENMEVYFDTNEDITNYQRNPFNASVCFYAQEGRTGYLLRFEIIAPGRGIPLYVQMDARLVLFEKEKNVLGLHNVKGHRIGHLPHLISELRKIDDAHVPYPDNATIYDALFRKQLGHLHIIPIESAQDRTSLLKLADYHRRDIRSVRHER